jgi:hypothetical protein
VKGEQVKIEELREKTKKLKMSKLVRFKVEDLQKMSPGKFGNLKGKLIYISLFFQTNQLKNYLIPHAKVCDAVSATEFNPQNFG